MTKRYYLKELHNALRERSVDKIKLCLNKGVVLDKTNDLGESILHLAVKLNNLEIIKVLLKRGADINSVTKEKATVLHLAIRNECLKKTKGTSKDAQLFVKHKEDIIKLLLKHHVDINAKTGTGESALHIAVKYNNKSIVELLLKNNANVNETTFSGITALHYTSKNCINNVTSVSIAELLLKAGAEIDAKNKSGFTALHLAVDLRNFSLANYLVSKKANVNCKTKSNLTPIFLAVKNNDIKMVKFLLQNGADVNEETTFSQSLLHYALKFIHAGESRLNIVKLLLKSGVNVDSQDLRKQTALHMALSDRDEILAELLIEHGSSVNLRCVRDQSPLYIAISQSFVNSVELLLSHGADPNASVSCIMGRNGGIKEHLLNFALFIGNQMVIQLMLKHGANVNASTEFCRTPLNLSILYNYTTISALLMEKGADVNLADWYDDTPLHMAVKNLLYGWKDKKILQLLLDMGADVTQVDEKRQTPFMLLQSSNVPTECTFIGSVILIKHMALMLEKEESIGIKNLNMMLDKPGYLNYFLHCLRELKYMRNVKIDNHITFRDVLVKEHNALVKCVRNENVAAVVQSECYKNKFPRFTFQLKKNFLKGQERMKLIDKARLSLVCIAPCSLPLEVATMICTNLSNADLANLQKIPIGVADGKNNVRPFTMTLRKRRKYSNT